MVWMDAVVGVSGALRMTLRTSLVANNKGSFVVTQKIKGVFEAIHRGIL